MVASLRSLVVVLLLAGSLSAQENGLNPPKGGIPENVIKLPNGNFRPKPGYLWLNNLPGDYRVVWTPGTKHSEMPNVVASSKVGEFVPVPGYAWLNDAPGDLRVVWQSGKGVPQHPNVVTSSEEGKYLPGPGYNWLNELPGDYRVIWAPGKAHSVMPNLIASDKEGDFRPAPGYRWVSADVKDLRVEPDGNGSTEAPAAPQTVSTTGVRIGGPGSDKLRGAGVPPLFK